MSDLVIVDVEQGSDAWHALRKTKRTASMTPMVTGTSRFAGPQEAYDYLTGAEVPVNEFAARAMAYGQKREAEARASLEVFTGSQGEPVVGYRGDYLASLDYLSADGLLVDIKVPASRERSATWKHACAGEIDPGYADQLEHQFRVFQPDRVALFVWIDHDTFRLVEYRPSEKRWDEIRAAWDRFIENYVSRGIRPPAQEERNDAPWLDLARRLIEVEGQMSALSAESQRLRAELIALSGGVSATGGGVSVRRYFKKGTVDLAAALRHVAPGVDLEPFRREGSYETRVEIRQAAEAAGS